MCPLFVWTLNLVYGDEVVDPRIGRMTYREVPRVTEFPGQWGGHGVVVGVVVVGERQDPLILSTSLFRAGRVTGNRFHHGDGCVGDGERDGCPVRYGVDGSRSVTRGNFTSPGSTVDQVRGLGGKKVYIFVVGFLHVTE